ncbi:MAG: SDR family oxidoreductase [Bacteroidota bacterium]
MKDKVVVITGASSGIGKALAYEFGNKGAKVVLAARNLAKLEEIVADLHKLGIEALAVKTDVSIENDCRELIEKTLTYFGRLDVMINNAGISMRALFADLQLDVMRRLMDTNYWGTVYCTKYAMPHLVKTSGSLVGVISIGGYIGMPGRSGYAASKFAVRGFLDTVRVENRKTGLHVLVVAPGFTTSNIRKAALLADGSEQGETPRDENHMMSAEVVAEHVYKAVAKRKRHVILTFVQGKLTVFLGKFIPKFLDKQIYNTFAKEPDSPLK